MAEVSKIPSELVVGARLADYLVRVFVTVRGDFFPSNFCGFPDRPSPSCGRLTLGDILRCLFETRTSPAQSFFAQLFVILLLLFVSNYASP